MAQSIAKRCLREAEMDGGEYEAMDDYEGELASIGGDPTVLQEMTHLGWDGSQSQITSASG
jgi:hypothetical protein